MARCAPQDSQPAVNGGGVQLVADAVGLDGFSNFDDAGERLAGDGGLDGGDFADKICVAFEQGGIACKPPGDGLVNGAFGCATYAAVDVVAADLCFERERVRPGSAASSSALNALPAIWTRTCQMSPRLRTGMGLAAPGIYATGQCTRQYQTAQPGRHPARARWRSARWQFRAPACAG